jgi:hypothetical protein
MLVIGRREEMLLMERTIQVVPSKGKFNISMNQGEYTFSLGTVGAEELGNILSKLCIEAETKNIPTSVFAYYHGDIMIQVLYFKLMDELDKLNSKNFHFEWQWG